MPEKIVEHTSCEEFFQTPNHPYSNALLKALPSEHTNKLETIKGQPPTIQQEITGCRFHPRCKHAMRICLSDVPELKSIGENHSSACWLNRE